MQGRLFGEKEESRRPEYGGFLGCEAVQAFVGAEDPPRSRQSRRRRGCQCLTDKTRATRATVSNSLPEFQQIGAMIETTTTRRSVNVDRQNVVGSHGSQGQTLIQSNA